MQTTSDRLEACDFASGLVQTGCQALGHFSLCCRARLCVFTILHKSSRLPAERLSVRSVTYAKTSISEARARWFYNLLGYKMPRSALPSFAGEGLTSGICQRINAAKSLLSASKPSPAGLNLNTTLCARLIMLVSTWHERHHPAQLQFRQFGTALQQCLPLGNVTPTLHGSAFKLKSYFF